VFPVLRLINVAYNMKKLLLIPIFFIGFVLSSTAQNDSRLGGFLAYGSEVESFGIGVNAEFSISKRISLSPSFIYYLPRKEGQVKINWWEMNANAHYYFLKQSKLDFFGLGGLNYTQIRINSNNFDGHASNSDGNLGLNLGLGANYEMGKLLTPFVHAKYIVMENGMFVVAAGLRIIL
jgi:outer membrane immunogenic protein